MKKYKVIQMGTGNTGIHALRSIIQHPDLELVGLWDYDVNKAGQDAGEICGLDRVGIKATNDDKAILDMDADCVCYMKAIAMGDPTKPGSYGERCNNEVRAFLESGKNVVGTTDASLIYPYIWGPEFVGRIEKSCQKGGSSFLWIGLEPGFMGDVLPLIMSGLSHRIDSIRSQEILCYATYKEPVTLYSMGFGYPVPDEATRKKVSSSIIIATAPSIQMIADALGVKLDEIRGTWEGFTLQEDIEVAIGTVKAGMVGAVRYEGVGIVGGKPLIAVEHVNRLRDDLAPQWAQLKPGGYRVLIEGKPSMKIEVSFTEGDPCIEACVATAARVVNSIPVACDSAPGVYTFLNLPRQVMGVHRI